MDERFKIERPCHERWDSMQPLAGGRFCDSCDKSVLDLTDSTEGEARERVGVAGACVRIRTDASGRPIFRLATIAAAVATMPGCIGMIAMGSVAPLTQPSEEFEFTVIVRGEDAFEVLGPCDATAGRKMTKSELTSYVQAIPRQHVRVIVLLDMVALRNRSEALLPEDLVSYFRDLGVEDVSIRRMDD